MDKYISTYVMHNLVRHCFRTFISASYKPGCTCSTIGKHTLACNTHEIKCFLLQVSIEWMCLWAWLPHFDCTVISLVSVSFPAEHHLKGTVWVYITAAIKTLTLVDIIQHIQKLILYNIHVRNVTLLVCRLRTPGWSWTVNKHMTFLPCTLLHQTNTLLHVTLISYLL